MTDLEREFRTLDRLDPPDLWPEAESRQPGTALPPRRRSRVVAAAVALVVASAGVGLAVRAFIAGSAQRTPQPATSVPRGAIAFVRVAGDAIDAAREIYMTNPDGSGLAALTDAGADGMAAAEPAWSPDGTKMAFVLGPPEHLGAYAGDGDIYVMNADGTRLIRLTEGLRAAGPAWSPDRTEIVFSQDQGTSLVVMNADGSEARELRLDGEAYPPYQSPAWSPDGTRIAFQASPEPGAEANSVYVTNVDGTDTSRLTAGLSDGSPAWSPDGATLAYAGPDGVYVHDMPTGTEQRVTVCGKREDCGFDFEPTWSPDGRRIAFTRQNYAGDSVQVFVVNVDGTGLQQLTDGPELNGWPSWNPVPVQGEAPSPTVWVSRCTQATTAGDFDGDGIADDAEFVEIVSGVVSCARGGEVFAKLSSQELVIRFGSGQTLREPFADCRGGLCAYVFEPTDLDGEGRDELVIDVSSGGATGLEEFYRVDVDGVRPLVIAETGDPPYVEPGPAILGGGFDSATQSPLVCRVSDDGTRQLISIHAENIGDSLSGPWRVHTTTMVLEGDRLVVTSTDDSESSFPGTSGIPSFSATAPFDNGCS
jgi:Tol biopolymer transport system component